MHTSVKKQKNQIEANNGNNNFIGNYWKKRINIITVDALLYLL